MESKIYEGRLPNGVSFSCACIDGAWGFIFDLPSGYKATAVMNRNGIFEEMQGPAPEKRVIQKSAKFIEDDVYITGKKVMESHGVGFFGALKVLGHGDMLIRYPEIMRIVFQHFEGREVTI